MIACCWEYLVLVYLASWLLSKEDNSGVWWTSAGRKMKLVRYLTILLTRMTSSAVLHFMFSASLWLSSSTFFSVVLSSTSFGHFSRWFLDTSSQCVKSNMLMRKLAWCFHFIEIGPFWDQASEKFWKHSVIIHLWTKIRMCILFCKYIRNGSSHLYEIWKLIS